MEAEPYRFKHTPALDGLRGLAILLVFLFHSPYGSALTKGGHVGVDLFLVLSGFLITSVLVNDGRRGRFYLRRALRLLPAAWFCAGVVLALDVWWTHYTPSNVVLPFLSGLCFYYLNTGRWLGPDTPAGLSHYWSLSLEEQFYLIWPWLLLLLWRRSPRAAMVGAFVLFGVSTAWEIILAGHGHNVRLYYSLDTRANAALLGAALALVPWGLPPDRWQRMAAAASRWTVPCLWILAASLFLLPDPSQLEQPWTLPAILASGLLIFVFACGPRVRQTGWFEHPWMVTLGRLSYSIYLWHFPIMVVVVLKLVPFHCRLQTMLVDVLLTGLCAWFSYRFIESPFLRYKNRLT